MRNIFLVRFAFLFTVAVLPVIVQAQARTCSLDLKVLDFQKDQPATEKHVEGAIATLTNAANKTIKASLFQGMPRFSDLIEGQYTITVSKEGFNKTIKEVEVDCRWVGESGSLSEIFFLFKGDSKQIHKVPLTVYAEGVKEEPTENQKNSVNGVKLSDAVSSTVVNSSATQLVKPEYPRAARAVNATGAVNVQVTIDELGNVVSAKVVSGHPLLRAAAVKAARESKFSQTLLEGFPVKITGIIVYNFTP